LPFFFSSEQILKICKKSLASTNEKLADSAARPPKTPNTPNTPNKTPVRARQTKPSTTLKKTL